MALAVLICATTPLAAAAASEPPLDAWRQNIDGTKGSSSDPTTAAIVSLVDADVQSVSFTDDNVFVQATGIPSHPIGPWAANPNQASNQMHVFQIPRNPAEATVAQVAPAGRIAVMVNGVSIYNPKDTFSYLNQGQWNQNAVFFEDISMDAALGHARPDGEYHHHQKPAYLANQLGVNSTDCSPLLGFAFDGFPIYGPYAYANTDGTGALTRMRTSYQLRAITERTTLPDGTAAAGPPIDAANPLGAFVEDYE